MPFRPSPRPFSRPAWLAAAGLCALLHQPVRAAPEADVPEIEAPAPDSARAPEAKPAEAAPSVSPGNPAATSAPAATADTAKSAHPAGVAPVGKAPVGKAPEVEVPAVEAPTDAGDITVEVDPRQSRNQDRSLPLAMLYSAVMPGTGELYLREKPDAKAFLLTEAGFWASLYVAFLARDSYLTSARNYASEYAGIDASGKSAGFLETMGNYRSYLEKQHRQDSYELAQILSGKRSGNYDIKPSDANYWDFGSSANPENTRHWNAFQSSLRYYRASKVAISFAVGALALNRLASLVNTLRVYKHTSAKSLGLNVTPEIGLESVGSRLTLRF